MRFSVHRAERVAWPFLVLAGLLLGGACVVAEELSLSPQERRLLEALDEGRFVRAREMSSAVLSQMPESFVAHYALGAALHHGDGNIPAALREYRRSRGLLEDDYGHLKPGGADWHYRLLMSEILALSDLGRYEELIELAGKVRSRYDKDYYRGFVWPLMKLGRIDEARRYARLAIATGDPFEIVSALNVLCSLDGYAACEATLAAVREHNLPPGIALRNLAVSAIESGRYERAEELLFEATRHPDPSINPWRDLANLYLSEGRLSEAASAAAKMIAFGHRVPPKARQYARAEELTTSAMVLLLAGEPARALVATSAALEEPDRDAHWSGSEAEIRAETELLHRSVLHTLAAHDEETAAILPWHRGPLHRARALVRRSQGWLAGRRVLPLLLEGALRPRDRAEDRQRPELGGAPWLLLDAVAYFGTGPTRALVENILASPAPQDGPVPPRIREAELRALLAEALCLSGRASDCLEEGRRALDLLPREEVLLRARLSARMAVAARSIDRWDLAAGLYDDVLRTDPGVFRRLDIPLPVRRPAAGGPLAAAARLAASTPRFVADAESPFLFASAGDEVCLSTETGVRLGCAGDPGPLSEEEHVAAEAQADEAVVPLDPRRLDDPRRRTALALLDAVFASRIDVSQRDLDSLDGAPTAERGLDKRSLDLLLYPDSGP